MTQHLPNYCLSFPATRHSCNYVSPRPMSPSVCPVRHVTHAVNTRISPCRCRAGGGCEMLVHRGSANHRSSVLETHRIPLEHTERTLLVLVRVISIKESVPEPLLFGLPSCKLKWRTRPRALPSAPFNARCDGFDRIGHGASPLLDRTSADGAAPLPRRPLISMSQGLYLSRFWNILVKSQRGCQGIKTTCPLFVRVSGVLYVPISCGGSMARPRNDDRILDEGRVGESAGLSIQPNTNCPARQGW